MDKQEIISMLEQIHEKELLFYIYGTVKAALIEQNTGRAYWNGQQ